MDYVMGNGVGSHVAGMFEIEISEMRVSAVYAIRLMGEGDWESVDDVVGQRTRLEAGLQYEDGCWARGARGTSIPRFTIHKVTIMEGE
jgi:hypothetical protein